MSYSPISGARSTPSTPASLPTTLAPKVETKSTPGQPSSAPLPFLAVLDRAARHHERGVAELGRGNADGAEQEFSTAMGLLMEPTAITPLRASYRPPRQTFPAELPRWQDQPKEARAEEDSAEDDAPAEEGDSLPSAPALVTPEDVKAIEREAKGAEAGRTPEVDAQHFDVPIVVNEQVQTFLHYFSTRKYALVSRAFERASRYLPMMRDIFREKGVPQGLLNLAFIESAFNPRARSRAGASGIWQFVQSTGRRFGMRSGFWVDERRDPELSTRGAAEYLKTLYGIFQDWPLALAAYNAGEGKVQQAIARQRTTDFWKLRLPKETRLFVPAFMAMTIIAKDPAKYGFAPPPDQMPEADVVPLRESVDLRVISRAAQTTPETVRHLNPTLVRGATPPGPFTLRLPPGSGEGFLDRLAELPRPPRPTLVQHQVKKGETWRTLARRHRVSVSALLELNGRDRAGPLKVGSAVLVSGRGVAARAEAGTGPTPVTSKQYAVKRGDTLARIAKARRVGLEDLRRWNGLTVQARLKPGQILTLQNPKAALASPMPSAPAKLSPTAPHQAQASARAAGTGNKTAATRGPRTVRYTVKPGDSLWTIAQAHGVRPEEIKRWNGLRGRRYLQPGQELQIILPESS